LLYSDEAVKPPKYTYLDYHCLADLYEHFIRLFVNRSPILSASGCRIHCYEHHFVHMVKLFGPSRARLFFADEKEKILNTRTGFGDYEYEDRRARRLPAFFECLENPDCVVRSKKLRTADRAFIKEFECSQYPFAVVLVVKENAEMKLATGQPIRRAQIKTWLDGEILFAKNTLATLRGVAR